MSSIRLGAALAVLSACLSGPLHAVDFVSSNATGFCNGSLPSFEGALRKRPLAIANQGATPAFVSCSAPSGYRSAGNRNFLVTFVNRTTEAVAVNCTLVDGVVDELAALVPMFAPPVYYPKSIAVSAGAAGIVVWSPAGEGVEAFTEYANVNCILPPGVEINLVGADYDEIGDPEPERRASGR